MNRISFFLTCALCVYVSACSKNTANNQTGQVASKVSADQVLGQVPAASVKQIRVYNQGGFPNPFQTDLGLTITFDGGKVIAVSSAGSSYLGSTSCTLNLDDTTADKILQDLFSASTQIAGNTSGTADAGNTIFEIDLIDGSSQTYRFLDGDAFSPQPVVISASLRTDLESLVPAMTCSSTSTISGTH